MKYLFIGGYYDGAHLEVSPCGGDYPPYSVVLPEPTPIDPVPTPTIDNSPTRTARYKIWSLDSGGFPPTRFYFYALSSMSITQALWMLINGYWGSHPRDGVGYLREGRSANDREEKWS